MSQESGTICPEARTKEKASPSFVHPALCILALRMPAPISTLNERENPAFLNYTHLFYIGYLEIWKVRSHMR